MASFHLNREAFRQQVLNADWMVAEMHDRADIVKSAAEAIAPVDEDGTHPGRYAGAFEVESGKDGAADGRRAYAIVKNTSPEAPYVEFGNGHDGTAQHVLLRASEALR